jgi:uncharacterized repeat protein (TIGR04138 family)
MSTDPKRVSFFDAVNRIRSRDTRYAPEAYALVMDSVTYAIRRIGEPRHVSARELLDHLCDFVKDRYGIMAYSVLVKWGLRSTEDIGAVVYALIDEGELTEQDDDSLGDFSRVFDLERRLEVEYFDPHHPDAGSTPHPG